ncbi:MAG: hypothetical protein OXN97_19875 [Bryobacterales bacterium]|nr:hypothetical protein [Bryobacterales bacterium]
MRKITVSVDEETHRRARARAAELDMSVPVLMHEFLKRLVPRAGRSEGPEYQARESALDRRCRLFKAVFVDFDARGVGLRMADNLPREALYGSAVTHSDAGPASLPNTDS